MKLFLTFLLLIINSFAFGNNFSCPYGKQGACLDYSDKVCSAFSKCVDQNATCFNQSACGYGGFVCKSDLESLANDYDSLASRCKRVASDYDDLVNKYNDLVNDYNNQLEKHNSYKNCIEYSQSLDDAKLCY
tara:strand:+ start:297 stop:692 length:396 start_codon:yes stop_codon:yes gene_type:complete